MAKGSSRNGSPSLTNSTLCNECGSNPWKYRCPGCSICSCSLPCVNSHKKRTSCTGKRNYAEVVPLSQFDDNLLLSDYSLLEETKRIADSARRKNSGFPNKFRFKLPFKLQALRNAAYRRRIRLLIFSDGMSKRMKNKSRYDNRKRSILWTVELRFHGTEVALFHHGVDEHGSLLSIFSKHLAPGPWKHKLKPFCDVELDDLKLFIRNNPKDPKSLFRQLDIRAPIGDQFEDIMILEYPIIFVYLSSQNYDFEVETGRKPFIRNDVPSSTCDAMPNINGTSYKVEEIEEGDDASDTRITDLMVSKKSEVATEFSNLKESTKPKNEIILTNNRSPKPIDQGITHTLCTNSLELADAGFYFDQEVRDAYSDLIGEMNPDDFLCLDGVYNDDGNLGEANWHEMIESKMDDSESVRDKELEQLTEYVFEISEGKDLSEIKGNDLEGTEANQFMEGRTGGPEVKGENLFLYNEDPFYDMELEEGEIPYFLS